MMRTGIAFDFANVMISAVDARTAVGVPGSASALSRYMVWMESTITMSGLSSVAAARIAAVSTAFENTMGLGSIPNRLKRKSTCPSDSSPLA